MTPTDDVLELVVQDHAEIKTLMNELATAPAAQDDIFERLVAKLATHETAEEEVVHPLARREAGADAVVDQLLEEESKGKEALAELEKIGVTDPQFASKFERVRSEVLRHAEHEEHDEHPRIRASVDADRLNRAAGIFETAQKIGPTHAHAHAPESATGNVVVGTFVAVADRVRDAVRDATKKAGSPRRRLSPPRQRVCPPGDPGSASPCANGSSSPFSSRLWHGWRTSSPAASKHGGEGVR